MVAEKIQIDRKIGIDILKGISAILIVLLHFPFTGMIGKSISVVARIAVPIFFMCSGYFLKKEDECSWRVIRRKVLHILKITIFAVILYIGYTIYREGIGYVLSELNPANALKVFIFNAPQISSFHLWFLISLIYSYILYYIICRFKLVRFKLWIAVGGIAVNLLVREVLYALGIDILPQFVRNAYFFGLPFFIAGTIIRDSKDYLNNATLGKCYAIAAAGLLLSGFENHFLCAYTLEVSLGTIIYSVSTFVIALQYKGKDIFKLAYLGRKCSLYMYIIHIIVGTMTFKVLVTQTSEMWIGTCVTLVITILISLILSFIENIFASREEKKKDDINRYSYISTRR